MDGWWVMVMLDMIKAISAPAGLAWAELGNRNSIASYDISGRPGGGKLVR